MANPIPDISNRKHDLYLSMTETQPPLKKHKEEKATSDAMIVDKEVPSDDPAFKRFQTTLLDWIKSSIEMEAQIYDVVNDGEKTNQYINEINKSQLPQHFKDFILSKINNEFFFNYVFNIPELATHILRFCSLKDVCSLAKVSKRFYTISRSFIAKHFHKYNNRNSFYMSNNVTSRLLFIDSLLKIGATKLDLTRLKLRDQDLNKLSPLDNLEEIILDSNMGCFLEESQISALEELAFKEELASEEIEIEYKVLITNLVLISPTEDERDNNSSLFSLGIQNLDLSQCTNLRSLEISRFYNIKTESFKLISEQCNKITKLHLFDVVLYPETIILLSKKCIQVIDFGYEAVDICKKGMTLVFYTIDAFTVDCCDQITKNWSGLKKLYLRNLNIIEDQKMQYITTRLTALSHLEISRTNSPIAKSKDLTFKLLSGLESLHLSDSDIKDNLVIDIISHCQKLRELDLSENPNISKAAIQAFKTHATNLVKLNLACKSGSSLTASHGIYLLRGLSKLEKLDVSKEQFQATNQKTLQKLKLIPKTELDLFRLNIIDLY